VWERTPEASRTGCHETELAVCGAVQYFTSEFASMFVVHVSVADPDVMPDAVIAVIVGVVEPLQPA
jgi:hypothetical protein